MAEYRDIGLMDENPFNAVIGKLVRANFQLKDLNRRFREFSELHPYRIVEEFNLRPDEEIGDYTFTIKKPRIPNREWGVLVGEIVHNLRSALDQAAYAASVKPSHDTKFPVCRSEEDWDKWSSSMVYGIPEKAVAVIKQAQPYRWGTKKAIHEVALLNGMWNHDKHRLVHTTALVLGKPRPSIVPVRDVAEVIRVKWLPQPLEHNAEVVRVTLRPDGPDPKLEMKGNLPVGVAFTESVEGAALKGLHVIAVLRNAFQAVSWIVGAIEVACIKS
jgi:hypothetical protein